MKTKHVSVAFFVLIFFVSCASLVNMITPEASPEMTALVKERADRISFTSPKKLGKSSKTRKELKTGQWVATLSTEKNRSGNITLTITKIISVKKNTVVIETETVSATGKGVSNHVQITYENYPVKGTLGCSQAEADALLKNMKIVKVLTRQGNQPVQEMPAEIYSMSKSMGISVLDSMVTSGDVTTEKCSTSYIESSLCYSFVFVLKVPGLSSRSGKNVVHSEIPVNGLVRMESEDIVMETIAFGLSGASSKF